MDEARDGVPHGHGCRCGACQVGRDQGQGGCGLFAERALAGAVARPPPAHTRGCMSARRRRLQGLHPTPPMRGDAGENGVHRTQREPTARGHTSGLRHVRLRPRRVARTPHPLVRPRRRARRASQHDPVPALPTAAGAGTQSGHAPSGFVPDRLRRAGRWPAFERPRTHAFDALGPGRPAGPLALPATDESGPPPMHSQAGRWLQQRRPPPSRPRRFRLPVGACAASASAWHAPWSPGVRFVWA